MAKKNKEAKDASTPKEEAIGNLQYALDRACHYIHDAQSASYSYRAVQAAREGVDKAVVLAGLDAMEAALADARQAVEAGYENPEEASVDRSRIRLSEKA